MAKLFKIVLDAGHGGKTLVEGSSPNNAVAPNGLLEKDLTLKIARLVKEKLSSNQFQTFLTRDKDENLSLKQRAGKSREVGADAFISIHFNAGRKTNFDGTEVFISESSDEKDYLLADQLLKNVANAASTGKRGIREVDFTVLKGKYHVAKTAACLVEMAYLTNPNQAKNLGSPAYLDKLASAVTQSIVNYTRQVSYAQSFAEEIQIEKAVAEFTREHSDPKNFPIDLPEFGGGTDKFSVEIPNGLKLSRWEVEVLESSTGAGYKVVKYPNPKSEGKQEIHIEWNHLPYGKIHYKLKIYASPDGSGTPEKIYFDSSGWMDKSKDQILQGIPFQLAVKGEKAKKIYEALRKKQGENAQQTSYENYSDAMEPITITVVVLVGIIVFAVLVALGFVTLAAIIKMALDKGYNVKDTKFKAGIGEGQLRQDHELAFNITKPEGAKSESFGLDHEFNSEHFESLNSYSLGGTPKFDIKESVGSGGANKETDVLAVKKRLIELGFTWLKMDSAVDSSTIKTIKLFQSIIQGSNSIVGDGKISVGKNTHRWLQAKNAPRWQTMSAGSSAEGYVNYELTDTNDTHDYGTNWIDQAIKSVAIHYRDNYLKSNPSAAILTVNDVSLERGGDTKDHSGHEAGLACDLQLPRTDGKAGFIDYTNKLYDQNAARGILQALKAQPNVSAIYFNDSKLIGEKLCRFSKDHHHHIHFEILPPAIGEVEIEETKSQAFDLACSSSDAILPAEKFSVFNQMLKYTEENHGRNTPNVYLKWNCVPKNIKEIDIVVQFHGFNIPDEKTINRTASLSGLDLSKRARPTLCIMPLAKSEPEYFVKGEKRYRKDRHVFPFFADKNFLQNLIDFSLKEFARQNNLPENSFAKKRLILTAHSGGGAAINKVLANKADNIDEVHLFDATYFGSQAIVDWVNGNKDKPNSALRIIYLPMSYNGEKNACYQSDTSAFAAEIKKTLDSLSKPNPRYRVERTRIKHNEIPNAFGFQLLEDAGIDLDDSNAANNIHPCWEKHKDKFANQISTTKSFAFYDESENDSFADRETIFRKF